MAEDSRTVPIRQLGARETKRILFESATTLIAEKGYDNVTVDDIVAKAGTSKGSFYTYFKSKDRIMVEQFKQLNDNYIKVFKTFSPRQSAVEKLLTFVKELYIFSVGEIGVEILKIVYATQLRNPQEKILVVGEKKPIYKMINIIISEGQKNGEFRQDIDAGELARMSICLMRGTFYDWCMYDGNFDLVEQGTRLFILFIDGIKAGGNDLRL